MSRTGALVALGIAAATALSPGTRVRASAATEQPPVSETAPMAAPSLEAPPPGARSPRNANYSIDVRLDPESRTLLGREVITWRNITGTPANELQFHLYYNAWKNTHSTWLRERLLDGDSTGLAARPQEDWGSIDVTAVRLLSGSQAPFTDLTSQKRYIAPDDGNAEDQTVMAVPLPQAVPPGEGIRVEIAWTSKIPRVFARTGAIGNYFFIVQWFPKLGVFEDAGWNTHQFHAGTEFFSDYGVYDVRMTVPTGWVLGATGLERKRTDNADRTTTFEFSEADVHDFAWTTSPDYIEKRARFEHPTLPPVDMRLLIQPEHESQTDRHFEATRAALKYYGEWYGPYPYGHITVIDPAYQSGAGGMEYPTLFTAGTRWLIARNVTNPEGVTVHEAGHQFWYAIVGNNEFEDAWMDEGLNTFSTARVIEQVYEPNYLALRYFGGFVPYVFRDIRLSRATDGNLLSGYRASARSDAQATPTFHYWTGTGGNITYNKTALWLHTLERLLGWPMLQRIMSTHFDRWKFRHPKPADFFAIANEVSGQDLTWYFDEVYRGSNVFDYGVQQLSSRPAAGAGFFDRNGKPEFTSGAPADPPRFRTQLVVRRYGEAIFPVDILLVFADGEEVRERWDGRDRWKMFTYERAVKADHAQVDPERTLLLDVNYTNNSRSLKPRTDEATTKWMLKWIVWAEDLLLTWGFFV